MIGTIVGRPRCRGARARVRFGNPPGIGLLMKWMICALSAGGPLVAGGCFVCPLVEPEALRDGVGETLRRIAPADQRALGDLDRRRVGRVEEEHRRRCRRTKRPPALRRAAGCASRSTRRRSRCRPGTAPRICGRRCSGRRRRRTRRSDEATRRGASAPRTATPRSGATWRESCCAGIEKVRARHVRRAHRLALCRSAGSP